MPKSKRDKAVDVIAKIVKEHLETLPRAKARKMLKELHDLAKRVAGRRVAA